MWIERHYVQFPVLVGNLNSLGVVWTAGDQTSLHKPVERFLEIGFLLFIP